jgi:phosphatidate cytidylyltransferase
MKQRVISAAIALLLVIPIIIVGGSLYYIMVGVVSALALKELIDVKQTKRTLPPVIKMIAYLIFIMLVLNNYHNNTFIYEIDYRVITILLATILLPLVFYQNNEKYNIDDALFLIGSIFFLGMAFNLLILVRNYDLNYLIYILLITIITDIYAYATGRLIGKHKLSPNISPKKTWEGFYGGLFFSTLFSSVFYYEVINSNINIAHLILISAFLCIVGQLGDLIFSSIKRHFNKKDYSNIMPGHGGILDRLDSLILVIIVFTIFITII